KLSTAFIGEEFPNGFHAQPARGEVAELLAAVAAAIDHVLGERKRQISGQLRGRSVTRESLRSVWLGAHQVKLEVNRVDGVIVVRLIDGSRRSTPIESLWRPGEPIWRGTVDGQATTVQVRNIPNGFVLAHRGIETSAHVYTEREAGYARLMPARTASNTGKQVICPMPGLVVSIAVKEGQDVKAGETVAVVEAMKMENVLRAEVDGTVKKINAKPGDSLAVDAVILEFA